MDSRIAETPSKDYWKIEAGPPTGRYARGWHCLGPADIYKDGKPHTLEAFGTKLVVFQATAAG